MFLRRFSIRNIFTRIRNIFASEDVEELEIEDEESELDELADREAELRQRISELEARENELLGTETEPVPSITDNIPDLSPDELDTELDEIEAQLDEIEEQQSGLTPEELEMIDTFGFISDDELQFRRDMADFFGVEILELADISVEDLEVLSRAFIFDTTPDGRYVGTFSTPADLVNSPLFDLLIGGYADYTIDEEGNISVYETDTDRARATS